MVKAAGKSWAELWEWMQISLFAYGFSRQTRLELWSERATLFKSQKIFGFHGKSDAATAALYLVDRFSTSPTLREDVPEILHLHLNLGAFSRFALCIIPQKTIASHEFPSYPCIQDEDGTERGNKTPLDTPKSGFIQAPASSYERDPARTRADIPPGGARSWAPGDGTGGGLVSGSRSIRRFYSSPHLGWWDR
ncbi:hypothetical protein [uncultured Aliiroseovarius sp.]|uniref:hypothetical protein n=1 Tax=uncultured Aliiroseovarius sp. TaxID=1658783 RepID=UPI00262AE495|nr:hypothetical protein [uncultured Aliiroseovarius sp.]